MSGRDAEPDWLRAAREKGLVAAERGVSAPDLSAAPARRGPPPPPPPEGCSEGTFQDHLRMLALWGGWKYYHTRDSRKSDPDFPDTVCARAVAQLVVIECKVEGREATPGQLEWIRLFAMIPGVKAGVFYPGDWPQLVEVLR
jgi:hypothetical protein